MSYLVQYATRRSSKRGPRVDERIRLNLPDLYGDAYVRVFVEDTSGRKHRLRRVPPVPHLRLRIADCVNEINLEFDVASAPLRANSMFKIDTLIGALQRFRDGLAAEAELYALREVRAHSIVRKEDRCRT
jgi:hypothetical protein